MKGIQNTSTENFSTIIGSNKTFIVPKFQRDYSWNVEQWDDLWMDIDSMLKNDETDHYMGYLVLQTSNDKVHYIIDGQQRISTLMLLILAALKQIKNLAIGDEEASNNARVEGLLASYIGKIDPVTLRYDNILVLNRNNDEFYRDWLVKFDTSKIRGLKTTDKLMRNAFLFFEGKLKGKYKTGKEYAEFIQKVADGLYFTKIVVSDELNAFRVFETLNARGVQLSSADLLKNYLFSLVDEDGLHSGRVEVLEEKWSKLISIIKAEKLTEFLRYYWNSKNKSIRSNDVYRTIRSSIKKDTEVFALVDDMIRYSDVYMALFDCNDEMWRDDLDLRKQIALLNLFRLRQPISSLMAAFFYLDREKFKKLIGVILNICFRYNVISDKNPNDQDVPFNNLAVFISSNKVLDLSILSKICVPDDEFERAFAEKKFPYTSRNAKVIRYILGRIDCANGSQIHVDFSDDNASIEHVLPQNFGAHWDIDEDKALGLVDRLGNMCLLERRLNQDIQDESYAAKTVVYKKSSYLSANEIADNFVEWNEDIINRRQARMAKLAKGIWNINFN